MISTNEGRGGVTPRVLPNRRALRRSLNAWKRAAIGLLVLAVLCNVAQALVHTYLRGQLEQELQMAEESRDNALQEWAAVSLATAQEKQARAAQAAEYEAVGAWEYIGECRLTAYCCEPYAHICGTGDGLTATGILVTPGMDRASGSGVFARDPDALLDLIELPIGEDLRKQEINNAVGQACTAALQAAGKLDEVSQDDLCSEKAALAAVEAALGPQGYRDTMAAVEAAKKAAEARTAWRIDGTLREFPKFPPVNLWFDFPVHRNDESGVLADIDPEGEVKPYQRGKDARKKQAEKQRKTKQHKYSIAIESFRFSHDDVYPTVKELFEEIKQSAEAAGEEYPAEKTVRNSLKSVGYVIDKNSGRICPESEKSW